MNVAACEVAVDTETGEVEILRFGVVADPGKSCAGHRSRARSIR